MNTYEDETKFLSTKYGTLKDVHSILACPLLLNDSGQI